MSVLAVEAPLADFVLVRTAAVGQRRPVKHRPMLLGVGVAEQRRALLLGAQVGEHVCAKAKTERMLRPLRIAIKPTLFDTESKGDFSLHWL